MLSLLEDPATLRVLLIVAATLSFVLISRSGVRESGHDPHETAER